MLQRAVDVIGSGEVKVLFEKDLAPHLTAKERKTTTQALVNKVKNDPSKTLNAYERLI